MPRKRRANILFDGDLHLARLGSGNDDRFTRHLVVPTWNFGLLYVFVILDHGRRVVRHFNITAHPTAEWVKQQLREAFPFDTTQRYLIFDRDTIFSAAQKFIEALSIKPKVTSYRSPWQNGAVERIVGSIRRDILDHVVVINEEHLRRLLRLLPQ